MRFCPRNSTDRATELLTTSPPISKLPSMRDNKCVCVIACVSELEHNTASRHAAPLPPHTLLPSLSISFHTNPKVTHPTFKWRIINDIYIIERPTTLLQFLTRNPHRKNKSPQIYLHPPLDRRDTENLPPGVFRGNIMSFHPPG